MMKQRVTTPEQALAYMIDCTLATVQDMACTKSRKKGEFQRQIGIAQTGIDWLRVMNVSAEGTRAADVIESGGSVSEWIAPSVVA